MDRQSINCGCYGLVTLEGVWDAMIYDGVDTNTLMSDFYFLNGVQPPPPNGSHDT